MNDQKSGGKARPSNRRGRGCLLWLGASLALLIGLILIGSIYESKAEAADALAYPPPGQMVDIGGYRLHINCTGTGSPTVVIDAGWGDFSTSWTGVQQEAAKTTQVCIYDRAGSGWSDPGPLPRNALQYAKELHSLLHNANIPGPYVLAGHSMGGIPVRVFTDIYPSEIAGVVLIDSMVPGQFTAPPQAGTQSRPFSIVSSLARIGVVRLFSGALGLAPTDLPAQEAKAFLSRVVRPASLQAYTDEGRGMPASGAQEKAVKTFGDIPLIVLTARLNSTYPDWQAWQAEQLQLSSNSQQMFAEKSGHNIQYEQPDAAVAAIVKMVELVRQVVKK
jgi:pimeloyl-ACP methyl ester carboxylesterase